MLKIVSLFRPVYAAQTAKNLMRKKKRADNPPSEFKNFFETDFASKN
jgi:hypothetical protein